MNEQNGNHWPSKRLKVCPSPDHVSNERHNTFLTSSDTSEKEVEVGINSFVCADRLFLRGLLKKRYTDFQVNEISPSGKVLHLTSLSATHERAKQSTDTSNGVGSARDDLGTELDSKNDMDGVRKNSIEQKTLPDVSDEDKVKLIQYFDPTAVEELMSLYESIRTNPKKKPRDHPTVRTAFTSDRSIRVQIHQDIRRVFDRSIDSSTDKDGILVLSAAQNNARKRGDHSRREANGSNQPQRHGKLAWVDRGGEYLHFTLYKENKDTMEVISFLSRQLHTQPKTFQFAGTKDRRAVTSQRVSAYRIEKERLARLNGTLRNAKVGDFEYKTEGLELGELGGNEFVVTLRECQLGSFGPNIGKAEQITMLEDAVKVAIRDLSEQGFLNYYGLQRFGTFATRTDTVGLFLLKGDFKGACDAILDYNMKSLDTILSASTTALDETDNTPSERISQDDRLRAKAISIFRETPTQHANEILNILPKKFSAETALIRHLSRNPSDYLGALMNIQRNLRLMYVHAYQSLVWNLAVGERWKLYADKVVEGDLVLVNEHRDKEINIDPNSTSVYPNSESTASNSTTEVDAEGDPILLPSQHDRATTADDIFERARPLTSAEASSGNYKIFDVVLPLPGYDVLYPSNASGDFYKTFMSSPQGGGLDPYDMRRKQKDFSLSGGYRKMIARIGAGWEVSVHRYGGDGEESEEKQFVTTDLERLEAERTAAKSRNNIRGENNEAKAQDNEETEDKQETGDKIAVVLKFQLGSSQYATMALRELSHGGIRPYQPDFGGGR